MIQINGEITTIKLISESNLDAMDTIEKLFGNDSIKELKVDNNYSLKNQKVYTITIHHDTNKKK